MEAIWKPLVRRDFKKAAALYQRDWIDIFSCFEEDLFLEVNPILSTATIPDEKPSLSTANSWKEVYKSETFWKKQLVSRLWAWPDCLDEDLFDFWVITSWELTCKKLLSELKMTCYTRKGVFKHVWIFEPYKIPDWQ